MRAGWQERIAALAEDHLSSSSALAARAADLLQEIAADEPQSLAEVGRELVLAQPAMAAVANVANVALRAQEALGAESVQPALAALQRGVNADRKAAAAALCERLEKPARVVTLSASASVIEALQEMRRRELLIDCVCGESRPLLEGTALARWLADQQFEVTLVIDAALAQHLGRGAIFLVGTDAILPHAIANKMGTRVHATWANLAGIERYVLATRDKLYPPELAAFFSNPERPASELLQNAPSTLHVENRAFDLSAREVWTEILIGAQPLQEAERAGDRALAKGLRPLIEST